MSHGRPIFPATAYTGDDWVATEFAKLYRPHSTEHEPGMKATDLIVLNQTPSYTEPQTTTEFLERGDRGKGAPIGGWMSESERRRRRKAEGLEETDGEGLTDEKIIEELAIASFMVPEILHDDDYEWTGLYDTTPGTPFHTTQGERDLREQIGKIHFPCETEARNLSRSCGGMSEIRPPNGEWVLVSAEGTEDQELSMDERENEEWNECQELSYFMEYDQATSEESFIVDNKDRLAPHNAARHEQRCALNALFNHPELDLKVASTILSLTGSGFNLHQEVKEKPHIFDQCGIQGAECSLVASGDNFSTAICRYGAVFVPKRCHKFINEDGTFTAKLTISTEGAKYPLRVAEITRC